MYAWCIHLMVLHNVSVLAQIKLKFNFSTGVWQLAIMNFSILQENIEIAALKHFNQKWIIQFLVSVATSAHNHFFYWKGRLVQGNACVQTDVVGQIVVAPSTLVPQKFK